MRLEVDEDEVVVDVEVDEDVDEEVELELVVELEVVELLLVVGAAGESAQTPELLIE